ncbi:metal-dependent hydrolase [Mycobacterium ahvazicum]|uniref:Metal-dependent hydrolase n=1 Tax=Mycobacterium ahvazicum TaxID=1964395 RepID=A0A2K4Y7A3_9MYCO|nr:metal-dependent hydrolase [Mycobacterium ahvazicum]SOX52644.1 metal-dependent hydrolase [Mycobacterium ahvazicum]
MTDVQFRKMRFDLDESVPFQWNPANPASGVMANMISFMAVGFERYIVLAVKEALKVMTDAALREEAEVFLAQECQHSAAHRRHVNGLIKQYPALSAVLDTVIKSYEDLYAARPLKFHLAYIASIEATFPALFSFMIQHRDRLYYGDSRVASLFMWHYVEEIEHRSSAEIIFDGVVGDKWYQFRTLRHSMRHVAMLSRKIADGIAEAVPSEDAKVDARSATSAMWRTELMKRLPLLKNRPDAHTPTAFDGIATREVLRLVGGLMVSQLPTHHPGNVAVPEWFHTWMRDFDAGQDMAHYYGVGSTTAQRR